MRGGRGGKCRAGRSAEPHLLAFEVAKRLIDGQGGHNRDFRLVRAALGRVTIDDVGRSIARMVDNPLVQDRAIFARNVLRVHLSAWAASAGFGCSVSQ